MPPLDLAGITVKDAAYRVLQFPAVADKTFLVTIGDRTVGGLCSRDPMVGPWQVPVADVAVTLMDFEGYAGEAMAMGERTPLALIDAPASGRMAVGEAITNLAAAGIRTLGDVKLSANWMAPAGHPGEDAALYDTVRAVAIDTCVAIGLSIPVGKDSMSMRTTWSDDGVDKAVTAPVSLIISAFAPVPDARKMLTPLLRFDRGDTVLVHLDLAGGQRRLGASSLAQVYGQLGNDAPDLDDPRLLAAFFELVQRLHADGTLLAYHDIGDGGLFVTLAEMAFASRCGLRVDARFRDGRRVGSVVRGGTGRGGAGPGEPGRDGRCCSKNCGHDCHHRRRAHAFRSHRDHVPWNHGARRVAHRSSPCVVGHHTRAAKNARRFAGGGPGVRTHSR